MSNRIRAVRLTNAHACSDTGILYFGEKGTMFSAVTGGGKTTALDLIRACYFANYTDFNKAAGGKSGRDVKSYHRALINATDENGNFVKYARTGFCVSYCLLDIVKNDKPSCVLGSCIYSRDETKDEEKRFFCIKGLTIEEINLLDENNAPMDFNAFRTSIETNPNASIKIYNTITDAQKLFAYQLGYQGDEEALKRIDKLSSKLYAFNYNGKNLSTKEFFRDYILKEIPVDIAKDEELLEKFKETIEQIEVLEKQCSDLDNISQVINRCLDVQNEITLNDFVFIIAKANMLKEQIEQKKTRLEDIVSEIKLNEEKKEILEKNNNEFNRKLNALANNEITRHLETLRKEKEEKEKEYKDESIKYEKFIQALNKYAGLISTIGQLTGYDPVEFDKNDFTVENNELKNFKKCLDETIQKITTAISETEIEANNLFNKKNELEEQIKEMEAGRYMPAGNTLKAIRLIENYFHSLNVVDKPLMLYECIDMKKGKEEWQPAVEAFLGNARFNIIVKPKYYNKIASKLKEHKLSNVTLIDTTAFNKAKKTDSDTICDLFDYKNEYAEAYLKYRFGKIKTIDSCVDNNFDKECNYLGKDSTIYIKKAYGYLNCDQPLYIGEEKRKKILENTKQEHKAVCMKKKELNDNEVILVNVNVEIKSILEECRKVTFKTLQVIEEYPSIIQKLNDDIIIFEKDNNLFEITAQMNSLENKIAECRNKIKDINNQNSKLNQNLGVVTAELDQAKENLAKIEEIYSKQQDKNIVLFNKAKDIYMNMLSDKRRNIQSVALTINAENEKLKTEFNNNNVHLQNLQKLYMQNYNPTISCSGMDSIEDFNEEYKKVKIEGYPIMKEKMDIAFEKQKKEIRDNIILALQTAIKEAMQNCKKINKELEKCSFNSRKYKITKITASPALDDINIFDIIMSNKNIKEISFFDDPTDYTYDYTQEEYNNVVEFLRANPKYLDYRNLISIDIQICTQNNGKTSYQYLSEVMKTNSGGEVQIPLYMILAIALNNLYEEFADSPLKILFMDEAFDKMDNNCIRTMKKFFDSLGFQIIIAAPESKNELFMEMFDSCIVAINNKKNNNREYHNLDRDRAYLNFLNTKKESNEEE